jgi:hypothetical protein
MMSILERNQILGKTLRLAKKNSETTPRPFEVTTETKNNLEDTMP